MTTITLDDHTQCVIRSEVNQRANNEDSLQVLRIPVQGEAASFYLLAIADGMGGHAHGEDVSREGLRKLSLGLLETLLILPSLNSLSDLSSYSTTQIRGALQSSVEQANRFLQRMVASNNWGKAGATLVLALVDYDRAWVMNLGDSPLFHWAIATKKLIQVTEDHTVTNVLVKGGRLSPEMAEHHHLRNMLDLYLGCEDLPETLPFYEINLAVGDRLLLCSDGVSGDLKLEELSEILAKDESLETIADELITASLDAGSTDNQTLILWEQPTLPPRKQKATPTSMATMRSLETLKQF